MDPVKSNSLYENQKETETFTVILSDGNGGLVSKTIEISVVGSNDLPTVTGVSAGDVEEELPGWTITVGPREAAHIPAFLKSR